MSLAACSLPINRGPQPCDEEGALFIDDFAEGRRCGWAEYNERSVVVAVEEGTLRISVGQPGQIGWTNPGRRFGDVIVNVTAEQVAGPDDNAYGVICRYQNPANFYVFLISGDGYYAIGKYQSGSGQIIYLTGDGQYLFSEAINRGEAANEIRVSCVGSDLSLTVNGQPLATVSDSTFPDGDIGLAASTFQPGTAVVQFDNVRVIAP